MVLASKDALKRAPASKLKAAPIPKDALSPQEHTEKGHIHCRVIVQMLGKPAEFIDQTLRDFMEVLKEDERYIILSVHYEKPEPQDDLFSTFAEVELWAKKLDHLIEICIDYMPASIEILEPDTFKLQASGFSGFLNDMQAKLHELDMIAKTLGKQNVNLRLNATQLVKNLLLLILKDGPKTDALVARQMGIGVQDLPKVLNQLLQEGYISKEGDGYRLKK